jgi:hypothetical protein
VGELPSSQSQVHDDPSEDWPELAYRRDVGDLQQNHDEDQPADGPEHDGVRLREIRIAELAPTSKDPPGV